MAVDPLETIVYMSSAARAVCRGDGIPQSTVYWNTTALTSDYVVVNVSQTETHLHILNASAMDTSQIKCYSENEAGRANATWNHYVNCEIRPFYARFLDHGECV